MADCSRQSAFSPAGHCLTEGLLSCSNPREIVQELVRISKLPILKPLDGSPMEAHQLPALNVSAGRVISLAVPSMPAVLLMHFYAGFKPLHGSLAALWDCRGRCTCLPQTAFDILDCKKL